MVYKERGWFFEASLPLNTTSTSLHVASATGTRQTHRPLPMRGLLHSHSAIVIQHRLFGSQPFLHVSPIVSFEDSLEVDQRSAGHSKFCVWTGLRVYGRLLFAIS